VLRALGHEGEAARAVLDALVSETADLPGTQATADFIRSALAARDAEAHARAAVGRLAVLAAAAALRRSATPEVVELFARTRLADSHGVIYGTSRMGSDEARRLLERALPAS
jgi:putative acyl-CoA dehydrogenase